jgi:hypothetical protein
LTFKCRESGATEAFKRKGSPNRLERRKESEAFTKQNWLTRKRKHEGWWSKSGLFTPAKVMPFEVVELL